MSLPHLYALFSHLFEDFLSPGLTAPVIEADGYRTHLEQHLEKLLSQPPLKGRIVLGFDPGYANGCKLAVLDETGKMLTVSKIHPFDRRGDLEKANAEVLRLINKYGVQIVAIGNGTASRESEKMMETLNPQYAENKQQARTIKDLQERADKQDKKLDDIYSLLQKMNGAPPKA